MLEETAATGCDTFVTADVKHDQFLRARELGLNLVDAGHFNTENVVIPVLQGWLGEAFPGLTTRIAEHGQPERYFL
jgi:putative NIF3 family GTP cyclohydrolase 1 type 2